MATIEGVPVYMESIDSMIYDKLYERLYDVYYNRNIALEHLLTQKLLVKEAAKRGISIDSLLNLEVAGKVSQAELDTLISRNGLRTGIPDPVKIGRVIDTYSEEGKEYLLGVLNRKLEREFVETLKKKYNIETFLNPPLTPAIDTRGITKYPINNASSKTEILIVSDFNCSSCQREYPKLSEIISRHSGSISFYYVNFSNLVSDEMVYADCMSQSGKDFSEVFKAMFELRKGEDDLKSVSRQLGVDHVEIESCMSEKREQISNKLTATFEILSRNKLTRTPALIIDGRVYYGAINVEAVGSYIESVLHR